MIKIPITPEQLERIRTADFRKGFIVNSRAGKTMKYGYVNKYLRHKGKNHYSVIPLKKISDGEFKVMMNEPVTNIYWNASSCIVVAKPGCNPGSEAVSSIIIYDNNDTVIAVCEITQ